MSEFTPLELYCLTAVTLLLVSLVAARWAQVWKLHKIEQRLGRIEYFLAAEIDEDPDDDDPHEHPIIRKAEQISAVARSLAA